MPHQPADCYSPYACVDSSDTDSSEPDIADGGARGVAEQSLIVSAWAINGEAVDGVAEAVKGAGESCFVIANWTPAGVGVPAAGGAGVDVCSECVFTAKGAVHSLQVGAGG
ncbi:hypothetical protein [Desulfuromusa kysingii]|uniref:hypothetical protein n=1 Tax=Desulfuromusa kysingii TaxID=37625 RepID=UPI001FE07A6C|nr:hypothetical protein [Desulfuromusa kysingii]